MLANNMMSVEWTLISCKFFIYIYIDLFVILSNNTNFDTFEIQFKNVQSKQNKLK